MDFQHPFLTQNIIAYIGNKRSLLGLIHQAIESTVPNLKPGTRFFDVFAGSGVVSRLGKYLGCEVYANDWEPYSYIINKGMIETDRGDILAEFGSIDRLEAMLEEINHLPDPKEDDQYIAKYYAPKSFDIEKADFRTERLFYTRENALTIDKIRNFIEDEYPPGKNDRVRNLLLALLLYEAATHTNTSGVFKAFHKGFGGHGRDAMKRILSPVRLQTPSLIDSLYQVHVFQQDAEELIKKPEVQGVDIAYLDPPYNQHQYGSNYHMLNTIALWDKIPAPLELNEKGVLKEKAAIRKDWKRTKSDYCYRDTAVSAFSHLLENIEAKHILISYSTDGIIPFEVMRDLCMKKGRIGIVTNEYTKYRGGKQSNSRVNTNIEFILTIDTGKVSTSPSIEQVESVINKKRILLLLKQKYSPRKLALCAEKIGNDCVEFSLGTRKIALPGKNGFELKPVPEINTFTIEETEAFFHLLSKCVCETKEEELEAILSILEDESTRDPQYYLRRVPDTLKKLAHKKNKDRYYTMLKKVKALPGQLYEKIADKIVKVEEIAEKRFSS
ncbi:MAG: DNA adenine methylase [Spirochaetia bacterium]